MKIVFLNDSFPPQSQGGPGEILAYLARGFRSRGHEVYIITTVRESERAGVAKEPGGTVFRIYVPWYHPRLRAWLSLYNPTAVREVARILGEIRPDVVHAHNVHYYLSYGSLRAARRHTPRLFLTAHDVMSFSYTKLWPDEKTFAIDSYRRSFLKNLEIAKRRFNPIRNVVIRRTLSLCHTVFAVSDELKRALEENGIRNVVAIYNGLDPNAPAAPRREQTAFRKTYRLEGTLPILLAGRLNHAKGSYIAIDAMAEVAAAEPRAVLFLAGMPEEDRVRVMRYAEKKGVQASIRSTPWLARGDMALAYATSEIVISPSLIFDSFPTVNLEAAQFKKPVVTTCFGGAKEFVIDGVTGYVINPYISGALGEKLAELVKSSTQRKKFGEAAFARLSLFTLDRQMDRLLAFYEAAPR